MSPNGENLIFATFVGGSDTDRGQSIEVDLDGEAYVVGRTSSTDINCTSNADNNENPGDESIFVMNLSADGKKTLYMSYFGESLQDRCTSIALVESESIVTAYFVGETRSNDFPTINAFDSDANGDYDCFLAGINIHNSPAGAEQRDEVIDIILLGASIGVVLAVGLTVAVGRMMRKAKEADVEDLYEMAMKSDVDDED
jgi:hypothetical protein